MKKNFLELTLSSLFLFLPPIKNATTKNEQTKTASAAP